MTGISELAAELKAALRMDLEPVGVRIYARGETPPAGLDRFEPETPLKSYCQGLALAGRGTTFFGGPKKLGCVLGTSVLGLEKDPDPLLDDAALEKYGVGLFATEEAGRASVAGAPKYQAGANRSVLIGPLGQIPDTPDLVVLEVDPEQVMWLLYAVNREQGGPQDLPQSGGVAGGCADVTTFVLFNDTINVTFLGLGCRLKSAVPHSHLLLGLPYACLAETVAALKGLAGPIAKLAAARPS